MIIKVEKRSSYGNDYIYPLNCQEALKTLTGKKTLSKADIEALKALDVGIALKQATL